MRLFVLFALVLSASVLVGAEATDPLQLARGLESDRFADRHEATLALRRMGTKAHTAILQAARDGSAEARTRALAILREQLQSPDVELQAAAKEILEDLAKGNTIAGRMANSILNPRPSTPTQMQQIQVMRAMQIRIIANRAREQLPANQQPAPQLPPAVGRFSITTNENGRRITVKGSEKGIQVEVTETNKDGKRVTNRYEAKNAAELKANHPEAGEIFEQMRQRFGLRDPNP